MATPAFNCAQGLLRFEDPFAKKTSCIKIDACKERQYRNFEGRCQPKCGDGYILKDDNFTFKNMSYLLQK